MNCCYPPGDTESISFEEFRNDMTIDVDDAGFVKTLPFCYKEFSKRGRLQSRIAYPDPDTVKHYN